MNDFSPTTPTAALHTTSDEDLARRVQAGCADSFNELAARLRPRLLFVLRRRLQNEADAEDIAQKTLLRAYEKMSLYDPARKFSPWLFTIALRLAADHHRKRQRTPPTQTPGESASAVADPQPTPAQQAITQEQSTDLWALAEQHLKPDQWTALWLLYGEGQTVKEIAQTLGRTAVSVRVFLFRARKTLAPHLAKYSEFVENTGAVDQKTPDIAIPSTPQVVRAES